MTHHEFLRSATALVRRSGAAEALVQIRRDRPAFDAQGRYHDTLAVFVVWAVDRLLAAGVTDAGVLWHPLTDALTPWAWYDDDTLASGEAHDHFVASTSALPGEPAPSEPQVFAAV